MKPYANESEVLSIDGLTIENRLDRISIYGNVDLTKDKHGLAYTKKLKAVFDAILSTLEAEELPDAVPPPIAPTGPRDPFA